MWKAVVQARASGSCGAVRWMDHDRDPGIRTHERALAPDRNVAMEAESNQ